MKIKKKLLRIWGGFIFFYLNYSSHNFETLEHKDPITDASKQFKICPINQKAMDVVTNDIDFSKYV